jgi:hypothetical protein
MMIYFVWGFEVFSLFRFKTNSKKTLREQDETSEPSDAESESSFLSGLEGFSFIILLKTGTDLGHEIF